MEISQITKQLAWRWRWRHSQLSRPLPLPFGSVCLSGILDNRLFVAISVVWVLGFYVDCVSSNRSLFAAIVAIRQPQSFSPIQSGSIVVFLLCTGSRAFDSIEAVELQMRIKRMRPCRGLKWLRSGCLSFIFVTRKFLDDIASLSKIRVKWYTQFSHLVCLLPICWDCVCVRASVYVCVCACPLCRTLSIPIALKSSEKWKTWFGVKKLLETTTTRQHTNSRAVSAFVFSFVPSISSARRIICLSLAAST